MVIALEPMLTSVPVRVVEEAGRVDAADAQPRARRASRAHDRDPSRRAARADGRCLTVIVSALVRGEAEKRFGAAAPSVIEALANTPLPFLDAANRMREKDRVHLAIFKLATHAPPTFRRPLRPASSRPRRRPRSADAEHYLDQFIDRSVSPRDDFFHYSVGKWLRSIRFRRANASWGVANVIQEETYQRLLGHQQERGGRRSGTRAAANAAEDRRLLVRGDGHG